MSASAHIARAKRHGVAFEKFEDREIFERDDYVCQCGCERKCDRSKVAPHPCAPSLGHIIPLSCGGDHTRANTQCQMWRCNAEQNHTEDTPRAAKIKRQRRETGQQARRAKRKAEGKPPLIQGRGFAGWRKFNNEVVKRG